MADKAPTGGKRERAACRRWWQRWIGCDKLICWQNKQRLAGDDCPRKESSTSIARQWMVSGRKSATKCQNGQIKIKNARATHQPSVWVLDGARAAVPEWHLRGTCRQGY